MRLYCKENNDYEENSFLKEWLTSGTDIDDLIFYNEIEKISEK